jgi:hypothetical protein
MHKGTSAGVIVGRCNVTNPLDDGRDPNWNLLEVSFRREGESDEVTAQLVRVTNRTGGIVRLEPLFHSATIAPSSVQQLGEVNVLEQFNFEDYAYYVEIVVLRSQASANAGIYPSVSLVRLTETIF